MGKTKAEDHLASVINPEPLRGFRELDQRWVSSSHPARAGILRTASGTVSIWKSLEKFDLEASAVYFSSTSEMIMKGLRASREGPRSNQGMKKGWWCNKFGIQWNMRCVESGFSFFKSEQWFKEANDFGKWCTITNEWGAAYLLINLFWSYWEIQYINSIKILFFHLTLAVASL